MRRIYISGKITGDDNYKKKFEAAEKALLKFFDNKVDVYNPAKLDLGPDATWKHYMRIDIQMLCSCDTIYMLSDWKKSRGARFERKVAKKLGIKIAYERIVIF